MADMFEVKVISPEQLFYEGTGSFVEFTTVGGRMGVYPNHIPLTTVLVPCVMKVHEGGDMKKIEISGGFVEVLKDKITVLAESAEWK